MTTEAVPEVIGPVTAEKLGIQVEISSTNGSITVTKVADGYLLVVRDRMDVERATYSMDRMKQNQWVLYRMDRKPTVRTHRVVDSADARVWVRENLDNLLKESGAMP